MTSSIGFLPFFTDPNDAHMVRDFKRRQLGAAERELLLAVLYEAIDNLDNATNSALSGPAKVRAERTKYEVTQWLLGRPSRLFDDQQAWPFSFANICLQLQLDPQNLRDSSGAGRGSWRAGR